MPKDHKMSEKYFSILDGGLSNVLEAHGYDLNHKLWTASLLERNPEAIIQAHLEYLKSGAQCITTASYQASIPGLIDVGYTRNKAEALIIKSVQLAENAVKRALEVGMINKMPLIAASIGSYGAYLADGSEYHGNYGVSDETLRAFHLERIKILDRTNADLLAFETMPDYQEAKVLSDLISHVDKPVWISFSCSDEHHLNDGTKIEKGVSLFKNHPKVFAIGVNCTDPKYISGIIKNIKQTANGKKIIIYPNSGEAYNVHSKTWQGLSKPIFFEEMTKEWLNLGADIIGGCCRIGPAHISSLRKILLKK